MPLETKKNIFHTHHNNNTNVCLCVFFHIPLHSSVAKLATLLVKTLAKPVSKRIKHDFSRNVYTKQMLITIGQATHSITSRMTIWSAGYTVRSITPLEVEAALTRGADFVGEAFVLFVSGSMVVWEYNRSATKDRLKEEARRAESRAERNALQLNFKALDARLRAVEEVVQYNSQSIFNVSGKHYVEPEQRKLELVPISEEEKEIAQRQQEHQQQQADSNSKQSNKDDPSSSSQVKQPTTTTTIVEPKGTKNNLKNDDKIKKTSNEKDDSSGSESPVVIVVGEYPSNDNNNGNHHQRPWWKFW
jgi:optic atrophy 3 protein